MLSRLKRYPRIITPYSRIERNKTMLNKEYFEARILQLNNDAMQLKDDANNLLFKLNAFINEHKTQRLMGEIIREGLDDNLIERIEALIPGIIRTTEVFDAIVRHSEALKSLEYIQNDTSDIAKPFSD